MVGDDGRRRRRGVVRPTFFETRGDRPDPELEPRARKILWQTAESLGVESSVACEYAVKNLG
jgi:hypothetical protein